MKWMYTTVVTVCIEWTPQWWLWIGWTPLWWLYVLDGHQSGDSMYLIDTTVVTLCIGWTLWWWLYILEGHHSVECMYWMDTTVVTVSIGSSPQRWLYVLDGHHSVLYVLDGHHSVLYVLDGHHSGDCMYWMVTTVVTVCIVLTTATTVSLVNYHNELILIKQLQSKRWIYEKKLFNSHQRVMNLWNLLKGGILTNWGALAMFLTLLSPYIV